MGVGIGLLSVSRWHSPQYVQAAETQAAGVYRTGKEESGGALTATETATEGW